MNRNLSKLGTQLLDIWKQLGASQRVTLNEWLDVIRQVTCVRVKPKRRLLSPT